MNPDVSIIIPTHGRRGFLTETLLALDRQLDPPPFEVVVVDDGTPGGVGLDDLSVSFPLHVVTQPHRGIAAARNSGARAAQGGTLLFLDDDMIATPSLVLAHQRSHSGGADVVLGPVPLSADSPRTLVSSEVSRWADVWASTCAAGEALGFDDFVGGNVSVRRDLFEAVGGYCESEGPRYGTEETELGLRLCRAGAALSFASEAIAHQRYEKSAATFVQELQQLGASDVAVGSRWPDARDYLFRQRWGGSRAHALLGMAVRAAPHMFGRAASAVHEPVVRRVDAGATGPLLRTGLTALAAVRYWLGVRDAGGYPDADRVVTLALHSVADHSSHPQFRSYAINPSRLDRMLRQLRRRGYSFASVDELAGWLGGLSELPRRTLVLTFDDAYEDLLDALPALRHAGAPGAVFVPTGFLGRTNAWEREGMAPTKRILSSDQLHTIERHRVSVGSHSRRHVDLRQLDDDELREEMERSAAELEAVCGARPRTFAYPYGLHDRRTRDAARRAGYELAFTVDPGPVARGDDVAGLRRIELSARDVGLRLDLRLWVYRSRLWRAYEAARPASVALQLAVSRARARRRQ